MSGTLFTTKLLQNLADLDKILRFCKTKSYRLSFYIKNIQVI